MTLPRPTRLLAVALLLAAAAPARAQLAMPSASPAATLTQRVGLTEVELAYARPSRRGRALFGPGALLPYGELWRTGANDATALTTDGPLAIGDAVLPAGRYALLSVPGAATWAFLFYAYEGPDWTAYREREPVARAEVATTRSRDTTEVLTLDVVPDGLEAAAAAREALRLARAAGDAHFARLSEGLLEAMGG